MCDARVQEHAPRRDRGSIITGRGLDPLCDPPHAKARQLPQRIPASKPPRLMYILPPSPPQVPTLFPPWMMGESQRSGLELVRGGRKRRGRRWRACELTCAFCLRWYLVKGGEKGKRGKGVPVRGWEKGAFRRMSSTYTSFKPLPTYSVSAWGHDAREPGRKRRSNAKTLFNYSIQVHGGYWVLNLCFCYGE